MDLPAKIKIYSVQYITILEPAYKEYKLLKLKDFIIGQEHDIIFIIIDKFTKWGYFVAYTEEILAKDIA